MEESGEIVDPRLGEGEMYSQGSIRRQTDSGPLASTEGQGCGNHPRVPGRGCGPGLGASGRPAGTEEASYQTLSRRSNYCQLGTPRLCLCS